MQHEFHAVVQCVCKSKAGLTQDGNTAVMRLFQDTLHMLPLNEWTSATASMPTGCLSFHRHQNSDCIYIYGMTECCISR